MVESGTPPKRNAALIQAARRELLVANPKGVPRAKLARLQKEQERDLFARTALVAAGFRKADLSMAMSRVREGMNANLVRTAYDSKIINPDGTFGAWRQSNPFVDHRTRLAAADMVMQMIPGMKAPKDDSRSGDIVVEVVTVGLDGSKTAVRVTGAKT